jgi:hypothetical protein
MKILKYIPAFILIIAITGCVKEFLPETEQNPELYVVEGLITDQPGIHSIKISKSIPLGSEAEADPVRQCNVWITDNLGNKYPLTELNGQYHTASSFHGVTGRSYTLHIEVMRYVLNRRVVELVIESLPMEMLPVPGIDSLFYEKVAIRKEDGFKFPGEGCQVFLNTTDPADKCRFYRWDYLETWKIDAPNYQRAINKQCWVEEKSEDIIAKTVKGLNENRIDRLKVRFISNETDRLSSRYRIGVNQYSVTEDEYNFWSDLEKLTEQSGSIYDIIPSSLSGNLYCPSSPGRQILGYFSVSAVKSETIYIDEKFKGLMDPYKDCLTDSLLQEREVLFPPPQVLEFDGLYWWIVEIDPNTPPGYLIVTEDKGCVDCTVRGSKEKPDYWVEWWEAEANGAKSKR